MSVTEDDRKVALVTGGGRGIGRGICTGLAEAGWTVAINYVRNTDAAREALRQVEGAGGRGIVVQADLASAEDRERLLRTTLDEAGQIELLVNNAGIAPRERKDILETGEESYDRVMGVNLKGPFFLTQSVAREMVRQVEAGAGRTPMIVNVGSVSAYASSTNRPEYCLSKAGVAMMTRLYADRLAEHGIRVYEVRPGIVETDMTSGVKEKYDRLIEEGLTPIRRWGRPADVARAVVALAEGALPFSTGEVINVDGGFHLRRL